MIYKGNFIDTPKLGELRVREGVYIEVDNDCISAIYDALPEGATPDEVVDLGEGLVIPGLCDIHLHAPQFANIGIGYDKELLPWLDTYTFPEEARFADEAYAEEIYRQFVHSLWKHGTLRSVVFGTIHRKSTELLMRLMTDAGLGGFVGKVNMDRNGNDALMEDTQTSLEETEAFLKNAAPGPVKPIVTPRFVPSCSSELMSGLGKLAAKYNAPVQSHLSENPGEIEWVASLHPESRFYGEVYDVNGLFGQQPTIMAHCVHSTDEEVDLMVKNGVICAHCPTSNSSLASGIAPIRTYLNKGMRVGLGSDISGGHTMNMFEVMRHTIQMSKLRWQQDRNLDPITVPETLYLATAGSGSLFGKVGLFEPGYEFDCLVIDDSAFDVGPKRSFDERLQRVIFDGDENRIEKRIRAGLELVEPA